MQGKTKKRISVADIAHIGLFTAVIAICSWIYVPTAIPFTMQTFAIFVTAGILGLKKGTLTVLVYILLGAFGIPVFSGFRGGLGILFSTTGGYIIGFIFMSLVIGLIMRRFGSGASVMVSAMALGLIVLYAFGTAWFMFLYARSTGVIGLGTALGWCVVPYIIPDALKMALAIFLIKKIAPRVKV